MMFSETACSMKKFGAMIGTRPLASASSSSTPRAPPQWSVWVWVKITAATGRLPRCWKYNSIAARAPSIGQRVDHDHAGVALDQRHVGDVEPTHLIDAGHHLEQ